MSDAISKLRALCEAATPGPWTTLEDEYEEGVVRDSAGHDIIAETMLSGGSHDDARFIAAARTALPLLLEVAEAASELCVFCSNDNLWRTKNALEALGKLELL